MIGDRSNNILYDGNQTYRPFKRPRFHNEISTRENSTSERSRVLFINRHREREGGRVGQRSSTTNGEG